MTISEDLKNIHFYDPYLMKEFHLNDKIEDRQMLQWYLTAKKINFKAIKSKQKKFSTNLDGEILFYKSTKNNNR